MIKLKARKSFSRPFISAAAVLIFLIILSFTSCNNFNNQDKSTSGLANTSAQSSNNYDSGNDVQDNSSATTSIAGIDLENKKNKVQKPVEILIKHTIPYFAAALIKHEVKNLFNDSNITEGGAAGQPGDYGIVVDIAGPQSDSKNYIIFCAVTNFYNLSDNISISDFKEYWNGNSRTIGILSEPVQVGKTSGKYSTSNSVTENSANNADAFTGTSLFLTEETKKVISAVYGDPQNGNLKIVDSNEIKGSLENNPDSFAIIPFEELRKELKVLNIDGKSIFDKDLSYESYPFSFSINFSGADSDKAASLKKAFEGIFYSNRDPDKMAVVNMTGVTALVRGVANKMDRNGILYPGEKIADTLKNGDIIHTSNEISFKEGCNAGQSGTTFCSKPEYIKLLKSVGINLVELTGNHLNDYGSKYLENTLKVYDELGWKYFGGGANLALSKEPLLYEINGNKIAFLGFNQFGPDYDWATRTSAGSAPPDNPYYIDKVKRLKEAGYNVIFTFQYEESYNYFPLDRQVEDFRMMRDVGADIVNGSQAHQPMGFEVTGEGLICYGLGNIFFDQMQSLGTRQGIIAKHIFYNGKHISTQLIPTIIDDYSQPRLMNEAEKKELLKSLYEASIKNN